jgi:hypothetical protein
MDDFDHHKGLSGHFPESTLGGSLEFAQTPRPEANLRR